MVRRRLFEGHRRQKECHFQSQGDYQMFLRIQDNCCVCICIRTSLYGYLCDVCARVQEYQRNKYYVDTNGTTSYSIRNIWYKYYVFTNTSVGTRASVQVYTCVCVCECVHVYTYVYGGECVDVLTNMCVNVRKCIYTCVRMCVTVCTCMYVYKCVCTCVRSPDDGDTGVERVQVMWGQWDRENEWKHCGPYEGGVPEPCTKREWRQSGYTGPQKGTGVPQMWLWKVREGWWRKQSKGWNRQ